MKKAQLQMTQNIAIIIVITFILVFGFIFYARVRAATIGEKITEYSALELVKSAQRVTNLPEITCSRESVVDVACVDELKIQAFIELNITSEYYNYYRDLFSKSRVEVFSVFVNDTMNFTIYDNKYNPPYNENPPIFIPINLYNPITKNLNFGYLQVTQYAQIR